MVSYDVESFLVDLKAFLVANLNTQLGTIDTDKNDGITLTQLDSGAYFFQTMNNEIANYNPFIVYGVESFLDGNGHPAETDVAFNAKVVLVMTDSENDPNNIVRLFRYQRALLELFTSNFDQVAKIGTIKVSGLAPDFVDLVGRPGLDRFIGINLEVHLPL